MNASRILVVLAVLALAVVALVLWPSDEDLDRRYASLDRYRTTTQTELANSAELIRYFDALKPVAKKKQELGQLRRQLETLESKARTFRDQDGVDRGDARRGLEELELQFFELMRSAEDLRARLGEMKRYKEILDPIHAEQGRLRVELHRLQETNTDPSFAERVHQILEDAKIASKLSSDGQMALTDEIVRGRTICEAAKTRMEEVNKGMRELVEEGGGTLPEPVGTADQPGG